MLFHLYWLHRRECRKRHFQQEAKMKKKSNLFLSHLWYDYMYWTNQDMGIFHNRYHEQ